MLYLSAFPSAVEKQQGSYRADKAKRSLLKVSLVKCSQAIGHQRRHARPEASKWQHSFLGNSICISASSQNADKPSGRRKFRSQTLDNMDRWKSQEWKSQEGKSHRREKLRQGESQRKKIGEETVRREKMPVREKVEKTVLFQCFVLANVKPYLHLYNLPKCI